MNTAINKTREEREHENNGTFFAYLSIAQHFCHYGLFIFYA